MWKENTAVMYALSYLFLTSDWPQFEGKFRSQFGTMKKAPVASGTSLNRTRALESVESWLDRFSLQDPRRVTFCTSWCLDVWNGDEQHKLYACATGAAQWMNEMIRLNIRCVKCLPVNLIIIHSFFFKMFLVVVLRLHVQVWWVRVASCFGQTQEITFPSGFHFLLISYLI